MVKGDKSGVTINRGLPDKEFDAAIDKAVAERFGEKWLQISYPSVEAYLADLNSDTTPPTSASPMAAPEGRDIV